MDMSSQELELRTGIQKRVKSGDINFEVLTENGSCG
jgi:hypothetical protein